MPSQAAWASTPSTATAASGRTPIFAATTRRRRGSQNSSATSERVDHSAPIQVAPATKAISEGGDRAEAHHPAGSEDWGQGERRVA